MLFDRSAAVLGGCAWGVEGVVECGGPEALLVAGTAEVPPEPEVEGGYDLAGAGVVWSVSGSSGGSAIAFLAWVSNQRCFTRSGSSNQALWSGRPGACAWRAVSWLCMALRVSTSTWWRSSAKAPEACAFHV